jgi:type II secretory pathway pseudopilin PulG
MKQKKLGTRIMTFVEITVAIIIAVLLSVALIEINSYNNKTNLSAAENGLRGLEAEFQSIKESSLRYAKLAADTAVSSSTSSGGSESLAAAAAANIEAVSEADLVIITDVSGTVLYSTEPVDLSECRSVAAALAGTEYSGYDAALTSRVSAVSSVPGETRKYSEFLISALILLFPIPRAIL